MSFLDTDDTDKRSSERERDTRPPARPIPPPTRHYRHTHTPLAPPLRSAPSSPQACELVTLLGHEGSVMAVDVSAAAAAAGDCAGGVIASAVRRRRRRRRRVRPAVPPPSRLITRVAGKWVGGQWR